MCVPFFLNILAVLVLVVHHQHLEVWLKQGDGNVLVRTYCHQCSLLLFICICVVLACYACYDVLLVIVQEVVGVAVDLFVFIMSPDKKVSELQLVDIVELEGQLGEVGPIIHDVPFVLQHMDIIVFADQHDHKWDL